MGANRLVDALDDLRRTGKTTVLPFLTGGHPDPETTLALLRDFEKRGVRIVEIGFPYSDPIADGPVIQASYTEVLASGVCSNDLMAMVRRHRDAGGRMALNAMVSYSIVYRHGPDAFLAAAAEAGFDGLIVPDLPMDEAAPFAEAADARGLCNILLVAPTTPADRRLAIARRSRGFIYYVSVAGITGERNELPPETIQGVADLRRHVETPVCVGFGISTPQMVRTVCEAADGAIVGSAIVHRIADRKDQPRDQLVREVGAFVSDLLAPVL